ncbi:hypothetical protein [Bacillus sp. 2205SS5-2]|uniref:hypothetical protein n=1 Tax=Bacillus sp. 2205SS5-2 TaxID=3109031 RepID=UPI003005A78A
MWQWILLVLSPFLLLAIIEETVHFAINRTINAKVKKERKQVLWFDKLKALFRFKKSASQ